MAQDRPALPAGLRRAVLEESGYACAIPTCRMTPVEIAHIEPWSKVQEHTFDNLIALCPNHHTRFDAERRIPASSMHRWKANLAVLNGRYSDLERRLLEEASTAPENAAWPIHRSLYLLIRNLLADGIIGRVQNTGPQISFNGQPQEIFVAITPKGRDFLRRWKEAEPLTE
ncbi:HNH endonuclease signature motif containing protein [Streptomyces sp. NPDC051665]|uniref:HNH endonuclease signature motif containing protein n=1 Tax=Streptomyces sp. NPDC051665 TaxID=3154647 RepID=UPI00342AB37F